MSEWEWRDEVKEALTKLEVKHEIHEAQTKAILDKVEKIAELTDKNVVLLDEHMRRTEINEAGLLRLNEALDASIKALQEGIEQSASSLSTRLQPVEKHVDRVAFAFTALKYVAGLSGLLGIGAALFSMLG